MRILIYLIILVGFGCSTTTTKVIYPEIDNDPILVDSIAIVSYKGYDWLYTPPPPPFLKLPNVVETEEEREQRFQKASEKAEQEFQKRLKEEFPNYDPDRDMPIPPKSTLLLDSTYKYHPSIDWGNKITLNKNKSKRLRSILECRVSKESDSPPPNDCWSPEDGVVYWKDGEIIHFYTICFYCAQVYQNWDQEFYQQLECIDLIELKKELKRIRKKNL